MEVMRSEGVSRARAVWRREHGRACVCCDGCGETNCAAGSERRGVGGVAWLAWQYSQSPQIILVTLGHGGHATNSRATCDVCGGVGGVGGRVVGVGAEISSATDEADTHAAAGCCAFILFLLLPCSTSTHTKLRLFLMKPAGTEARDRPAGGCGVALGGCRYHQACRDHSRAGRRVEDAQHALDPTRRCLLAPPCLSCNPLSCELGMPGRCWGCMRPLAACPGVLEQPRRPSAPLPPAYRPPAHRVSPAAPAPLTAFQHTGELHKQGSVPCRGPHRPEPSPSSPLRQH